MLQTPVWAYSEGLVHAVAGFLKRTYIIKSASRIIKICDADLIMINDVSVYVVEAVSHAFALGMEIETVIFVRFDLDRYVFYHG